MAGFGASALMGGLGAAAPGLGAAIGATLGERMSYAGKQQRQQLRKDVDAMNKGQLGFSQAERSQRLGQSLQDIRAGIRDREADLRREAAATGGFGNSGLMAAQQGQLASAEAAGAAQAGAATDAMSQQQVQAREADIRNRIETGVQRARATGQTGGQAIGEGVKTGLASAASKNEDFASYMNLLPTAG